MNNILYIKEINLAEIVQNTRMRWIKDKKGKKVWKKVLTIGEVFDIIAELSERETRESGKPLEDEQVCTLKIKQRWKEKP